MGEYPKNVDRNGKTVNIGDIVKIEGSPNKSDNGLYVVVQNGTSCMYSGGGLTMYKVARHSGGLTLSSAKYNIAFWPLTCFSNRYNWSRADYANATIEIVQTARPEKVKIISAHNYTEPETSEKDYFHCELQDENGRRIEDFNYSINQPELLQAVLSSITPKSGQNIVINKVVNDRYYYDRLIYKVA